MATPTGKTPTQSAASNTARSSRDTARTVAMLVLVVLATLFAVLNVDQVKVNWIFGSGRAPLIIVIVISLLVGIVLTYSAERLTHKRRQREP